jgi:hypothetical protein
VERVVCAWRALRTPGMGPPQYFGLLSNVERRAGNAAKYAPPAPLLHIIGDFTLIK